MTMTRKLFLIVPAAIVACALGVTGAAAAIPSAPDTGERAAVAQFDVLAQAQMKAAPKKKAGGAAARPKPATITPACPKGQAWNAAQKMCLPAGPAATPIPIPGTR
jgi:hypothetical protein